jgi:hypothetical protein
VPVVFWLEGGLKSWKVIFVVPAFLLAYEQRSVIHIPLQESTGGAFQEKSHNFAMNNGWK